MGGASQQVSPLSPGMVPTLHPRMPRSWYRASEPFLQASLMWGPQDGGCAGETEGENLWVWGPVTV